MSFQKHHSVCWHSVMAGQSVHNVDRDKGRYTLVKYADENQQGLYDKPLPCFGCGIGWFS